MADTGAAGSPGTANVKPPVEGAAPAPVSRPDVPAAPVATAKVVPGTKNNDANKAK